MGVERVEHPVARGVYDVPKVHVGAAQPVLHEREDLAQMRAHIPGADDVVDTEGLLLRVDAHAHLRRARVVTDDDDLCDVLLDVVERGEEHLLWLDSLRVDVAVAHRLEHVVHDPQLREVVGRRRARRDAVVSGDRGSEALPQAAAVEPKAVGEPAGDDEGGAKRARLRESFEDAHCRQV